MKFQFIFQEFKESVMELINNPSPADPLECVEYFERKGIVFITRPYGCIFTLLI